MGNAKYILVAAGLAIMNFSCSKEDISTNENSSEDFSFKANEQYKVDVCHTNGEMVNVDLDGAYNHLRHGDYLFSCNPSDGVHIDQLEDILDDIIDEKGWAHTMKGHLDAFEVWYLDQYLTGVWDAMNAPEGGGGSGSGGSSGGSLGGGSL